MRAANAAQMAPRRTVGRNLHMLFSSLPLARGETFVRSGLRAVHEGGLVCTAAPLGTVLFTVVAASKFELDGRYVAL
jgi:hypothetical protein